MKLTPIQADVIAAAQLRADEPIATLRRRLKLRDHAVRYAIDRVLALGIIERRFFFNLFKLGYQQHEVFFSLSSEKRDQRNKLIEELVRTPAISWIGKVGGDFQYGINICIRHSSELLELFNRLSARYGKIFLEKSFAQKVALTYFGNRYISAKQFSQQPLSYQISAESIEIDTTDHTILAALGAGSIKSIHQLARNLSLPQSTVDYRIKRLRDSGVIIGSYYNLNTEAIGMLSFLCLICAKGFSPLLEEKVSTFCSKTTAVVIMIRTLGSWDFELVINVAKAEDVLTISDALFEDLGGELHWYKMLPLFSHAKVNEYPFTM